MIKNTAIELADGRMTACGAATYLGLSVRTLENKRSNGTGPKFVKRGRVFYFKADLDEWLQAARASSNAELRERLADERGKDANE